MATESAVEEVQPEGKTDGHQSRSAFLGKGRYDIPAERYLADPCPKPSLSSHIAHLLLAKSPRHAWLAHPRLNPDLKPSNDTKFDLGRAAHALLLEGAGPFEIIDAPNWKSEAARDERAEVYRLGKIPLLEHEWTQVSAVVRSVRKQLKQHTEARTAFVTGRPERTLIWKEGPVWCRARCDWITHHRGAHGSSVWDFKTTENAAPQAWTSRQLYDLGGDIQAAFYRRGMMRLYRGAIRFRFVVAELNPPYGVSVVELSELAYEVADFEVQLAIDAWGICQRRKSWPGYSRRTFTVDPPIWKAKEVEARKMQLAVDQDSSIDPWKFSIEMWKP